MTRLNKWKKIMKIVEDMTNEDGEDMGYYTSIITDDELLV